MPICYVGEGALRKEKAAWTVSKEAALGIPGFDRP